MIAIGDNLNDISMLERRLSSMNNATDEVKHIANMSQTPMKIVELEKQS